MLVDSGCSRVSFIRESIVPHLLRSNKAYTVQYLDEPSKFHSIGNHFQLDNPKIIGVNVEFSSTIVRTVYCMIIPDSKFPGNHVQMILGSDLWTNHEATLKSIPSAISDPSWLPLVVDQDVRLLPRQRTSVRFKLMGFNQYASLSYSYVVKALNQSLTVIHPRLKSRPLYEIFYISSAV